MFGYIIYFLLCFAFCFLIVNLCVKKNYALDSDYDKPQSIHFTKTPRILGLSFILFFVLSIFLFNFNFVYKLIFLSSLFCAMIGLVEDFNINLNPIIRFIIQFVSLIIVFLFIPEVKILDKIHFLPKIFQNDLFRIFFTIFAIITIVNSFNFIDGLNGFLILYSVVISTFLLFFISDIEILNFLYLIIFHLLIILFFNFPKSKAFLGDYGSYFLGYFFALLFIHIDNYQLMKNDYLSSWVLANLFAYPAFEIFSTITRRIFSKKSPFYPDNLHLHSITYKLISMKLRSNTNAFTSIILIILILICLSPLFILKQENFAYLFFAQFIIFYLIRYIFNKIYNEINN